MPTIYDNIENKFEEGLNRTLENSNRADFCIGYFNLRGWEMVSNSIEIIKTGNFHKLQLICNSPRAN